MNREGTQDCRLARKLLLACSDLEMHPNNSILVMRKLGCPYMHRESRRFRSPPRPSKDDVGKLSSETLNLPLVRLVRKSRAGSL